VASILCNISQKCSADCPAQKPSKSNICSQQAGRPKRIRPVESVYALQSLSRSRPPCHRVCSLLTAYDSAADTGTAELSAIGSVSVVRDIPGHRQSEKAMRESEERFRASFANASIGFAMTGPDGRFLGANAAYCSISGYSVHQLQSSAFAELVRPDDRAANMTLINRMVAGKSPVS
jgi:PAS domain-containing protein